MNKKQSKPETIEDVLLVADKVEPVFSIKNNEEPKPNITRDKTIEQRVWQKHIKRIVDRYDLRNSGGDKFEYCFFSEPKDFDDVSIYLAGRAAVQEFCSDQSLYPGDFRKEILGSLYNGKTDIILNSEPIDLKDKFRRFLESLLNEGVEVQGEKVFLPHFLEWLRSENATTSNQAISSDNRPSKKLRADQEDKIECKKIANKVWEDYPILGIVHLTKHPEIKKIAGFNYTQYKKETIHRWLSEIAPEEAKKPGKRPPETREKQKKICEKIGIKI